MTNRRSRAGGIGTVSGRALPLGWLMGVVGAVVAVACSDPVEVPSESEPDGGDEALADEVRRISQSLCQTWVDCRGGGSADFDGCMQEGNKAIAAAQGYGCLDIVAAWFGCLDDNVTCTPDGEYTDQNACHDQEELGEDCINGRL